jgi:hypothetical protein
VRQSGRVISGVLSCPVGTNGALGVESVLSLDPPAERVAIDCVRIRDQGVTVAFDVVQESAERLLPQAGDGVPCPAGRLPGDSGYTAARPNGRKFRDRSFGQYGQSAPVADRVLDRHRAAFAREF